MRDINLSFFILACFRARNNKDYFSVVFQMSPGNEMYTALDIAISHLSTLP